MRNKKFNIIDVIIILVVLAIICVGVYVYFTKFAKSDVVNTNTADIRFTIEVNGISEDAANSFNIGDSVTFGETTSGRGIIENVEVVNYRMITKNTKDGTIAWADVPDEYTARVTITSTVTKSETAYTSGNETIAVGREMPFNAKGAAAEDCYIIDLSEVK